VVDFKEEAVAHAYSQQIMSIQGDATDPEFLETLGIQKGAKAVVAITNSDSVNVAITLASRVLNPNIFIIARVNNAKMKDKLLLAGANQVVVANDITALVASEYLGQPIAYEAISDILLHSENAVLEELTVLENSKLIGKTLDKLDNSHFNLTILGIMQNNRNFIFNPKKDEYIVQKGDILIVIGFADSITYFKQNFFANKVIRND
jgi:voltage-gated potassium channel